MVRFIEDQVLHLGQVKGSVIQMIKQTAGTGDNDLNARPDLFDLWQLADPAVYRYAANSCLPAQLGDVAMNLLCQFTGRGDDEGPDLAARAIEQPLQNREDKGGGLASAGLGQAHNVTSLQDCWNSLFLDRGWGFIITGLNACSNFRMKIKLCKTHLFSLCMYLFV